MFVFILDDAEMVVESSISALHGLGVQPAGRDIIHP
jgi:hypothetical protein